MYFLELITNIFFPKKCIHCQNGGHLLCPTCLAKTAPPFEQLTPWIYSSRKYRNPIIRKAVWTLKYRGSHAIANDLAPLLYDELVDFLGEKMSVDKEKILLVPIPMTARKKRERGFNQSEILAKAIQKQNKDLFDCKSALTKTKETIPQAQIKQKSKRLQNMRGVFVHKNSTHVKGRTIILVDDITTTGATLTEARRTLKQSGAKQVFAITIGH